MPRRKFINPFYVLLTVVGSVFALTACGYVLLLVRGNHASAVRGVSYDDSPLLTFLDRHGLALLVGELAVLAVATVLAIGTDGFWTKRAERRTELSSDGGTVRGQEGTRTQGD